jgi:hypothetical protein
MVVLCTLIALLLAAPGFSQSFDVASVRLSAPDQRMGNLYRGGPGTADPGRFTATNVVLGGLLMRAFGVQRDQLTSPDWCVSTLPQPFRPVQRRIS